MVIRLFKDKKITLKNLAIQFNKEEVQIEITQSNIVKVEYYVNGVVINKFYLCLNYYLKNELKMCDDFEQLNEFITKYNLKTCTKRSMVEELNKKNTKLYLDKDNRLYIYYEENNIKNVYCYSFNYIYKQIYSPLLCEQLIFNSINEFCDYGLVDFKHSTIISKQHFNQFIDNFNLKRTTIVELTKLLEKKHLEESANTIIKTTKYKRRRIQNNKNYFK